MDEVQVGFSPAKGETLDVVGLQRQLETLFFGIGDRLLYLPTVTSTNTLAMRLAHERPEEGVVVLTDSQTAGKGRQGRRWVDMPGCNVLSSILLRPLFPPHLLVMIASLAVVDAIADISGLMATIKWPNDVLINNRKVAGILIETSHDQFGQLVAILGVGVNVNGRMPHVPGETSLVSYRAEYGQAQGALYQKDQAPLLATATTLETEYGRAVSRESFIVHLLRHVERDYLALQQESANPFSTVYSLVPASQLIRERWRKQLSTLGRPIEVRQGDAVISGIAEDVDGNGELLLRRHSGELVSITWGDVGYLAR